MDWSVLTHAPVVLLRAEEAVEEDDGWSIVAEAFEAAVGRDGWLVKVVGEVDSVAKLCGRVQSKTMLMRAEP